MEKRYACVGDKLKEIGNTKYIYCIAEFSEPRNNYDFNHTSPYYMEEKIDLNNKEVQEDLFRLLENAFKRGNTVVFKKLKVCFKGGVDMAKYKVILSHECKKPNKDDICSFIGDDADALSLASAMELGIIDEDSVHWDTIEAYPYAVGAWIVNINNKKK